MASNNLFRLPPPIIPGQVGIALIVSNDYRDTNKRYLNGTEKDASIMVDAFSFLGYGTILKQNVTRVEIFAECEKLAGYDYSLQNKCKRIAVVFSGHGDMDEERGVLIMQDEEKVFVKDLVNSFKATSNPTLASMARMFFIDACRGSLEEPPVVSRSPRGGHFRKQASSEAGLLIAYSTTEYHKAYEGIHGGFWIQCLAREMCTSNESLCTILTKVNKELNEQCNRLPKEHAKLQTAQFVSQLIEDVYFLRERPLVQPAADEPPMPSCGEQPTEQMETEAELEVKKIRETLTSQGITCQYHITETPPQQHGGRKHYSCELSCLSNGMNYKFRSRQAYHNRDDAKRDVNEQARQAPEIGGIFSRSVEEQEDHTSRVDKLAEHCKSKTYRPPSYSTKLVANGCYVSTVLVPRNGKFVGEPAENIEQAKERAAKKALLDMGVIFDSLKLL